MSGNQIRAWMRRNFRDFIDECGEVDCTLMVEAWDRECADGGATLDPHHPAWDIAFEISDEVWKGER